MTDRAKEEKMNCGLRIMVFMAAMCVAVTMLLPVSTEAEEEAVMIDEKNLSIMPCKYVSKRIVTEARYMDTSTNLMDDMFNDMKTRFDARTYLNFRTIDQPIMRYFMPLKKADIIPTLKQGDPIVITGVVTSCADDRAWIDVDSVIRAPTN
jgi:hypothetical protein